MKPKSSGVVVATVNAGDGKTARKKIRTVPYNNIIITRTYIIIERLKFGEVFNLRLILLNLYYYLNLASFVPIDFSCAMFEKHGMTCV